MGEERGVGAVGARVVVDDEFVVSGVFLGGFVGGSAFDVGRGVGHVVSSFVGGTAILVFEAADEEFTRKSNVRRDVAVHSVFAEHVDAEFLAGFGEAE